MIVEQFNGILLLAAVKKFSSLGFYLWQEGDIGADHLFDGFGGWGQLARLRFHHDKAGRERVYLMRSGPQLSRLRFNLYLVGFGACDKHEVAGSFRQEAFGILLPGLIHVHGHAFSFGGRDFPVAGDINPDGIAFGCDLLPEAVGEGDPEAGAVFPVGQQGGAVGGQHDGGRHLR